MKSPTIRTLEIRHLVLKAIRQFFYDRHYLEVETSYLAKCAPSDPYIDPVKAYVAGNGPFFLHTSPEVGMKKLLAYGFERIFQICKVFRVEEFEEHHSIEFTMVEWYRPGTYLEMMAEAEALIRYLAEVVRGLPIETLEYLRQPWKVHELGRLFVEFTGIDPMPLSAEEFRSVARDRGLLAQGGAPDEGWADIFFRLLVQEVEPRLIERERSPFFVKDWPATLTAMAKKKDEHTVERFELYMKGLEIANGYSELLDGDEQRRRIEADNVVRLAEGKEMLPPDEGFFRALENIDGPITGVSIGIDRLIMVLLGKRKISEVIPDRFVL